MIPRRSYLDGIAYIVQLIVGCGKGGTALCGFYRLFLRG